MTFYDLSLTELLNYQPKAVENEDFDTFWKETLDQTRKYPLDPKFLPVDYKLKTVDVYDLSFNGYNGQPIKGWFILPKEFSSGKLPCIVEYVGYGGGRSFPYKWLIYPSAGYAYLVMDARGQGSAWSHGDTPDLEVDGSNPNYPGFMTRGILSPYTYYYRRLISDAVRAIEAARSHPNVNQERIAITGISQGGGLTLAVGGLVKDIKAIMPSVPFLCHYRRAVEIIDTMPYNEITHYLKIHRDKINIVFSTLSYFDGINFSKRAMAPALFSVGLMDDICPPSTVFAAYNNYSGINKKISIYEFNNHEGGEEFEYIEKLNFLKENL